MRRIINIVYRLISGVLCLFPRLSVKAMGGVFCLHKRLKQNRWSSNIWHSVWAENFMRLEKRYWESFGSYVGPSAEFDEEPTFPHGPWGVFISSGAHIGKGCTIFQHVTIGSNTLKDSKRCGYPFIGDNVYIGSGAKIIGAVHVGDNARIGANCVVVKDVPANSVTVIRGIESIVKDTEMDNHFVPRHRLKNT